MMNFASLVLEQTTGTEYAAGTLGSIIEAIGLSTFLLCLIVAIAALYIIYRIIRGKRGDTSASHHGSSNSDGIADVPPTLITAQAIQSADPVIASPIIPRRDDTNEEEIIAVIAAAIACATQDVPQGKFRVVSFKKRM